MSIQKWPDGLPRAGNRQFEQMKSISPWFEIYKINEKTFALLEPHHDEEVFSFILLGDNKAVLIDTGMGISDIRREVENITKLPVMVVNTHTHFDHTGDNCRFDEIACFNDTFELNNLEQGHSKQFCQEFMQSGSYQNLPDGFVPEDYYIKPSKATRTLNHLDQLDLGNRTLVIHHTPGHSPGSICIEDTGYRILFTGDTYYRGSIFVHLPGSDQQAFFDSGEYLYSLLDRIDILCPGHNECLAPKDDIGQLHSTLGKIKNGLLNFEIDRGSKFYQLDHFNLRLPLTD